MGGRQPYCRPNTVTVYETLAFVAGRTTVSRTRPKWGSRYQMDERHAYGKNIRKLAYPETQSYQQSNRQYTRFSVQRLILPLACSVWNTIWHCPYHLVLRRLPRWQSLVGSASCWGADKREQQPNKCPPKLWTTSACRTHTRNVFSLPNCMFCRKFCAMRSEPALLEQKISMGHVFKRLSDRGSSYRA